MKNIFKLFGGLLLLGSVASYTHAACSSTDIFCYPIGTTVEAQLTSGGALNTNGAITSAAGLVAGTSIAAGTSATVGTKVIFTSANQRLGGVGNSITPSSTFINLVSSAAVAYGPLILNISTATATDGQYLVLIGTSTTNAVTLSTGAPTGVAGVDTSIVITTNPTSFIFNALTSLWYEIGKL